MFFAIAAIHRYTQLSQWLYTVLIQNPTTSARLSIARALYESVIADNTSAPVLLYTVSTLRLPS